jgi:transcriptional regulator with XRE-family HTH domain
MTIQNCRIVSKIENYLYIVLIGNIIAKSDIAVARNRGKGMARSSFIRARPSEDHEIRGRANEIDIAVGKAVRFFRIQAGMSLATLGSKLRVAFQQIQKYESGANRIGSGRLSNTKKKKTDGSIGNRPSACTRKSRDQFGHGETMTEEEARQIVGEHTTDDEMPVIAAALSIRPAENTDEDWKRLEAACLLLGHLTPPEALAALKVHKRFLGE